MNVLDLFSGIGGFSLGLERAGMQTVAFCECDPYCRRVLAKHWPDVPIYDDVRTLTAARLATDAHRWRQPQQSQCNGHSLAEQQSPQRHDTERLAIEVICGGFPCQDISVAGKGAGLGGERSGLWSEYARIVGEVRPRYVIVENVAALLGRGLATVLGDLAALGFDAEWHCIPASAVGAPHRRDRVWIVAHTGRNGDQRNGGTLDRAAGNGTDNAAQEWGSRWENGWPRSADETRGGRADVADADQPRPQRWLGAELQQRAGEFAAGPGRSQWDEQRWFAQSGMGRVAHGTANRVDRLRALGNAVVPQIPEIIGHAIMRSA